MRNRNNFFIEYGTYVLVYFASYIASLADFHLLSGILLIGLAVYLFVHWSRQAGTLVELRALFTLAWVGGQGVSCLQFSRFQTDWSYLTWIAFFLVYVGFSMGYDWGQKERKMERMGLNKDGHQARKIGGCIQALAMLSVLCFFIELKQVGFVPVLSGSAYSYSAFYVAGIHYGTFCCVLIPALSVLFIEACDAWNWRKLIFLLPANAVAIVIPYICGSRFQLLLLLGLLQLFI